MSPIKSLSDSVRLPRLGKIHLGTRHPEKGYPIKTDYFVLPKDHSDYDKLVVLFGEQPKSLNVLIPVEDEEQWATQYYKCYNQTYGLVCKGDGEIALQMVDIKTEKLPEKDVAGTVTLKEIPCAGKDCPNYQSKKCHEVMNLKFIIPEAPGLGVWQIDTGSKNSILNINSCARMIKGAFGRISLIPLKLTLEPIQVNNPENGKKQTVYVLNLRTDITLSQLADSAREQAKMFMIEAPNLEGAFDTELAEDIEGLFGTDPPNASRAAQEAKDAQLANKSEATKRETVKPPAQKVENKPQPTPVEGEGQVIDMAALKESIKQVRWTEKTATSWLVSLFKVKGGILEEVVGQLNREQLETFLKEINDRQMMS